MARRQLRRPQLRLLVCSAIVAIGLVVIGIGVLGAETGRDAQDLPDQIERVDPVRNAVRVPAQSKVFVDLVEGYEGVLVIDGLEIETTNLNDADLAVPGQQRTLPPTTIYEPGNATLTFTPSDEAPIQELTEGEHVAAVIFWEIALGRSASRTYTWRFNVY